MFAIRGNGYPLGLAPHWDRRTHHRVAGRVDHRDSARADATKTITIHNIGACPIWGNGYPAGVFPTGTVAPTVLVAVAITETVPELSFTT
jgi:hypothetical protein